VAHVVHQQRHGVLKLHFARDVHEAGPQPVHDGGVFVAVLAVQEGKHDLGLLAMAGQRLHDPSHPGHVATAESPLPHRGLGPILQRRPPLVPIQENLSRRSVNASRNCSGNEVAVKISLNRFQRTGCGTRSKAQATAMQWFSWPCR